MARETMAALITRLRRMVSDVGATPVFDDDALQDFLDGRRTRVRYLELIACEAYAPGGGVVWLDYHARNGNWESGETLTDGQGNELTPAESDRIAGHWIFETSTPPPVYLTGSSYDLAGAAADVCDAWVARVKTKTDVQTGQQRLARSQQVKHLADLAEVFRRQARPQVVHLWRDDP